MTTPMSRERVEKVSWNLGSYIGCPESTVKALLDDNDTLRQRVEKLERELSRKTDDWADRVHALAEATRERDALAAKLAAVERERDEIGKQAGLVTMQRERAYAEVSNLRCRIKAVDAEHDDMERQKHKSKAAFLLLEQRLDALAAKLVEMERERDAAKKEAIKWQRIRQPTHGNCCTCQRCGLHHDDCRCDLDEVADELTQATQQVATLTRENERLRGILGKCIGELRRHVFCGDAYPVNGWPTVNAVLAEYVKFKRQAALKETP